MPPLKDLTGQRFGRLVVLERIKSELDISGRKIVKYRCKCDCGNIIEVRGKNLKSGDRKSCGCLYKETREDVKNINYKHGKYNTRLYSIWRGMKSRCYTKTSNAYVNYGARGISVCEEWKNDFMSFYNWSMLNGYDENAEYGECTIDRIDVNGNYEPNNCRWVNTLIQSRNKRLNSKNTSGYTGISFNKRIKSWEAHIGINGNKKHIGNYKDINEAIKNRKNAEEKLWNSV